MKVAVSILSSDYSEEETILKINSTDADYLHVDVMDGHFVSSITNFEYLNLSNKPLDVHLMVSRPFEYISKYANMIGTKYITIHVELEDNLEDLLKFIKSFGINCGLAINPDTNLSTLTPYYSLIDQILVMSVQPGKGGQTLIESTLDKLIELARIREEHGYNFIINVDGGINADTILKVHGADMVVSGSYICKSEDYQDRIDKIRVFKPDKKC